METWQIEGLIICAILAIVIVGVWPTKERPISKQSEPEEH